MITDTEKDTRGLLQERYRILSAFEQLLLQALAIIYEPVSRDSLAGCLRRAGITGAGGERITSALLAPVLEKLHALGFLEEKGCCREAFVEIASREAVAGGVYAQLAEAIQAELPVSYYYGRWSQRCQRALREFRVAMYTGDLARVDALHSVLAAQCGRDLDHRFVAVKVCAVPFQPDWFRSLPPFQQFYALDRIFDYSLHHFHHLPGPFAYLADERERGNIPPDERLPFYRLLANYLLWRGDLAGVSELIRRSPDTFTASGLEACVHFLRGDNTRAIGLFESDLRALQRLTGKRGPIFHGTAGLLYVLALLKTGEFKRFEEIRRFVTAVPDEDIFKIPYAFLEAVLLVLENRQAEAESLLGSIHCQEHGIARLFAALVRYWLHGDFMATPASQQFEELVRLGDRAAEQGFRWPALEFATLLHRVGRDPERLRNAERLGRETGLVSIIDAVALDEPWRRSLKALTGLAGRRGKTDSPKSGRERLVWMISYEKERLQITPRVQKRLASGNWSKGRPVSLGRLQTGYGLDYLTEQDRRICAAIRREQKQYQTITCRIDYDEALPAMVGHPGLLLDQKHPVPVEFVRGEPELLVEESDGYLELRFSRLLTSEGVAVVRETPTRFQIIEINETQRYIARIVGRHGLKVPLSAADEVKEVISSISKVMTVHSTVSAGTAGEVAAIREVEPDARVYFHLLPVGTGFRLGMYVRPLSSGGPYLKPGQGVEHLIAEVDGRRLQTRRRLDAEHARVQGILRACPTLELFAEGGLEWDLQEVEDCLQVLLELEALGDEVVIEWPEGRRLSVSPQVSSAHLNLRLRERKSGHGSSWFEVEGSLDLDESLVLEMTSLLELVRNSPGRFIPLGEGQFLALTCELRRHLEEVAAFTEPAGRKQEKTVRIHPLAIPAIEELAENAGSVDTDEGWERQLALLEEVRRYEPEIPSTIRAELRDYQVDGFVWLARLARLGAGACLADDMGLGKTVQALAIILLRSSGGPTLVVAPTSVCMNWQSEADRFTPTLNVQLFGGRQRKKQVERLGEFDVLVTSYTMLQQETRLLTSVRWQTIVLDEAQAIKNLATKRSKAAMKLSGGFKMITTGTPIENHLGELWNLFNFINPGLLGSMEHFHRNFSQPIERHQDKTVRRKLRKLIRPFILRRIKSQVLEELPPRTEIILHVEMSREEAAFYEALRRSALNELFERGEPDAAAGRQGLHVRILAQIMKLRRACCHPRLVAPDSEVDSSKVGLFGKVLAELRENRHKALVFSQFVGYLALLREFLDERDIQYCYLDGATPPRERNRQVEAFQAGNGDLFLISLKAGGLGLNLTAADYVIHMDPWWNPAVEDQASDRAHRLGQKRAVTIYRLVMRNTIEEKIVRLHREKRDLADSLLDGTDVSARMSVDELLDLIREK